MTAGGFDSGTIGERASVFDGLPWSVYLPPHEDATIEAATDCELALCSAPASGRFKARVIKPGDVGTLTRGTGSNARFIRNVLPEDAEAESLLVVEVITPGGHWSSYPPHKHDRDALPDESYLEETYYHRLKPAQGFAFQRIYTEDGSLDEALTVKDGDVVLVPNGYHPVGAPHGYDLYYLNVMAGPKRIWRFYNDPEHEWLMAQGAVAVDATAGRVSRLSPPSADGELGPRPRRATLFHRRAHLRHLGRRVFDLAAEPGRT